MKPIDFHELYRLLDRLLAPRRVVAAQATPTTAEDEEVRALSRRYLESLPAKLIRLETAIAGADWEGVTAIAHQIAGTAGTYGFALIFAAAERLEQSVMEPDEERLHVLYDELAATVAAGLDDGAIQQPDEKEIE